jgi:hypothetical protein
MIVNVRYLLQISAALVLALWALPGWAQDTSEPEHHFLLGLKDPSRRNEAEARALAERLRARLHAARLPEHRVEVDREHFEVRVEVQSGLKRELVESLLVARGQARIVLAAPSLEDLGKLHGRLPEAVSPGLELVGERQEIYLQSPDRASLERFAESVSWVLPGQTLAVGPAAWNQEVEGWRTWALSKEALALEGVGLREVELQRGAHPNYYYLITWWDDLSRAEAAALPAGALAGREGLETLIQQAQGRRLLLMIDGRVVLALGEVEEAREGKLMMRLPRVEEARQLLMARQIAGLLASPPHPCALAVIRSETR